MTDSTFEVICDGHASFRKFNEINRKIEKSSLYVLFGAWSGMTWRIRYSPIWGFSSKNFLVEWCQARSMSKTASDHAKGLVALERLAEIDLSAENMIQQFSDNDIVGMHKSIGKVSKCYSTPGSCTGTRVLDKQGNVTHTYREERETFRQHFCDLMQGTCCSFADAIKCERDSQADRYGDVVFEDVWMSIPSPTDVAGFSIAAKAGKAPGENRIIGGMHRSFC